MGNIVALTNTQNNQDDIRDSVSKALKLIDYKTEGSINSVAIKPNLMYYWNAATGYTTDTRVVAGIIDYVREIYGKDTSIQVVESDATAMRTNHAFTMLGYRKMAEEKNVQLFNLSKDTLMEKKVTIADRVINFKVPVTLLDADLFINVPKLKLMRATKITCAMKNIFGCIASPRKIVYHPFLEEAIIGINKILHPHLNVVDGVIASAYYPVKLGLIMASTDVFSIDWIASRIMRCEPTTIEYLRLARKENIGDPNGITIVGDNVERFRDLFPKKSILSSDWSWDLQLGLLKLYARIVGDIIPPILDGV
jgi:uncharacterized protein (DUF362 family)